MNNSEDYKVKYLKYKKEYLNLKEELDGGGVPDVFAQAVLYIILDVETYNLITTIIKRSILSTQFMDTILTGSAIKIEAGSNKITFLNNKEKNNVSKQLSRRQSALVGISLPEYIMKSNENANAKDSGTIGTTKQPYRIGSVYNNAGFIHKMSTIIVDKLKKRSPNIKTNNNDLKVYTDIEITENALPFYGIFLFEANMSNCYFIEAYKLEKSDAANIDNNNTVATIIKDSLNVQLVKDNSIFNLQSPYLSITDPKNT